ncbi:MAG TPA: flagellar M-ring protein FliF C-terminal domain-containing protein [Phycisphaerae bacterium]|nr:flagellar M-ring protein FliF C-terminal domain-containing protein [Phycisphaerae bacterium]
MEFFGSQFKQVSQRLQRTTTSQRVAVGLLIVLLTVGMWGMISWGGAPEWAPLLDQSFTAEEIQRVQRELTVAGIPSRIQGDRVEIRAGDEERQRMQALLIERGALPTDTTLGYAVLVKENSVFVGEQKSRWLESRGLEAELSAVLRRFQGINDARVLITVPPKRGFGRGENGSSASVALTMQEGQELDKQRIMAIASFVAGAVPGLEVKNVRITDGKRSYALPAAGEALSTELLEQQRNIEEHYMRKLSDQLRHIEGVVVNVHAKLRSASERSQQEVYGPPVIDRETTTTEEMTGGSKAAEPSVRPNTRAGLTDGGTGTASLKEESDSSFNNKRDVKMTVVDELRGSVERVSASVSVPRSYLERILGPDAAKSGGSIEKVAASELPRIRALVKPLIDATKDDQVVVDWYYDAPAGTQPTAQAAPSGVMALAKDYGPQAGLGLLALGGLFMVLRIARKASAAIGMPATATAGGAPVSAWDAPSVGMYAEPEGDVSPLRSLESGPTAVGEARELQGVLTAHEVDENTVRTQQIVKQIGQMVKEDASTAAGIINQWVGEES